MGGNPKSKAQPKPKSPFKENSSSFNLAGAFNTNDLISGGNSLTSQ